MALVVLGCGWIARRHAAAARRLRLPLIFASRDADRARRYAREFGGVGAYGDYALALRDPRARAALVCTPHDRHLDDVLEDGVDFFGGKEFAVPDGFERLLAALREIVRA